VVGTRALVSAPLFTLPASRRRSPEPAAGTARLAPSRSGEGGQQALYRAVDPRRVGKHRLRLPYPSGPAEKPLQLPTPPFLPPAACYSGRYGARATESNSSNPASQGSLTAEPIGVTRQKEEDCESSRERWNCGAGAAPPL